MTSAKRQLSSTHARQVTVSCAQSERDSALATCERLGLSQSELLRAAMDRGVQLTGEPPDGDRAYLSARLEPEQIDAISQAAQSVGMEPTMWLRYMISAYCGDGPGELLERQLRRARTGRLSQASHGFSSQRDLPQTFTIADGGSVLEIRAHYAGRVDNVYKNGRWQPGYRGQIHGNKPFFVQCDEGWSDDFSHIEIKWNQPATPLY